MTERGTVPFARRDNPPPILPKNDSWKGQPRDDLGRWTSRPKGLRGFRMVASPPRNDGKTATMPDTHIEIPLDENGLIPKEILVSRMMERCPGKAYLDASKTDVPIIEKPTPEAVRDWWINPLTGDIRGVDDGTGCLFDIPEEIKGNDRKAQGRIAVLAADRGDQHAIRLALHDAFTRKELNAMTATEGLTIDARKRLPDVNGLKCGGLTTFKTASPGMMIHVNKDYASSGDIVVHEAVHHSRLTDDAREGIYQKSVNKDPTGRIIEFGPGDLSVEESLTTLETVARRKGEVDGCNSYYSFINSKKAPKQMVESDWKVMEKSGSVLPNKNTFEKSYIKHYQAPRDNFPASVTLKLRENSIKDRTK